MFFALSFSVLCFVPIVCNLAFQHWLVHRFCQDHKPVWLFYANVFGQLCVQVFLCRTVNRTSDGDGGVEIWPQNPQGEGTFFFSFFFWMCLSEGSTLKTRLQTFFLCTRKSFLFIDCDCKTHTYLWGYCSLIYTINMPQMCFFNFKNVPIKEKFTKLCISQSYDIKYHFVIKVSDLNVLRLKWNLCGLFPSQLLCLSSWHFFLIWSYYALDCYLYILFFLSVACTPCFFFIP